MLAIGFPLDLGGGPTVTQGIVSGLDRTVHADDGPDLEGLLQTDAAINPGNSGGALVDSAGRLIGINTIAATGAENIGFAIAIDGARSVIDEIRSKPAGRSGLDRRRRSTRSRARPPPFRSACSRTRAEPRSSPSSPTAPPPRRACRRATSSWRSTARPVRSAADMSKALAAHKPGDSIVLDVVDQSGPRRATVKVAKRPATLPGG